MTDPSGRRIVPDSESGETHVTTDFGTAPLLAGLALGGIGAGLCLSSVLRRSPGELLPGA